MYLSKIIGKEVQKCQVIVIEEIMNKIKQDIIVENTNTNRKRRSTPRKVEDTEATKRVRPNNRKRVSKKGNENQHQKLKMALKIAVVIFFIIMCNRCRSCGRNLLWFIWK